MIFDIRVNNLRDFANYAEKFDVDYWLFGRTLLYVFKANTLSTDKFDEVCVHSHNYSLNELLLGLHNIGFSILKKSKREIHLIKNERELIVRLFSKNSFVRRINIYKLDIEYYFNSYEKVQFQGYDFKIPQNPSLLLQELYANNFSKIMKRIIYSLFERNVSSINYFKEIFYISIDNFPRIKNTIQRYIFYLKNGKKPTSFYLIKKLSLEDFYSLEIDHARFNWKFREKHLNIISDNGKYKKIGQILNYLKSDGVLDKLQLEIIDTPMHNQYSEPIYWSRKFWSTGNNYFINSILNGFRKGVSSYSKVNYYINEGCKPALYSDEYYKGLPQMNDDEIKIMLKKYPLEITSKGFSSGRHRACAMIGRLIQGQSYIPIYAQVVPKP